MINIGPGTIIMCHGVDEVSQAYEYLDSIDFHKGGFPQIYNICDEAGEYFGLRIAKPGIRNGWWQDFSFRKIVDGYSFDWDIYGREESDGNDPQFIMLNDLLYGATSKIDEQALADFL